MDGRSSLVAGTPGRTVVLHHEEPGGGHHFDWLLTSPGWDGALEGSAADRRDLLAFRCWERPDTASAAGRTLRAERLADHRRLYLSFEGDLSEGRGRVRRVGGGLCAVEAGGGADAAAGLLIRVCWGGRIDLAAWRAEPATADGRGAWRLVCL